MNKILIGLLLLVSIPCFANANDEEDEISKPMHYSFVPSLGYHLAFSQMSGSESANTGFMGGVALRIARDGYFFTPGARLIALVGLDKSPATMWTVGFIAGGHLKSPDADVFLGVDLATINSYKVGSAALVKLGATIDLGLSDFQVMIDAFYGVFSQTTATTIINYPYPGAEVSLQIPLEL